MDIFSIKMCPLTCACDQIVKDEHHGWMIHMNECGWKQLINVDEYSGW